METILENKNILLNNIEEYNYSVLVVLTYL